DMLEDPDDLAIVEGVMGLVTAFRRQAIAEGVETVAHGELLLSLGCELAQGYGIARAMPAGEFPEWAATWCAHASWGKWRKRRPNRDDQILVFAEVEHRHWLRGIEVFLAGERDVPPPLDSHSCHFGRWQESDGKARFGQHVEFANVIALHERVHAMGRKLVNRHTRGQDRDMHAQLSKLHGLRDELIDKLRRLVGVGPADAAP
ncbi:CZB domain-containing protein, partial [bacterium]|nr:CZB domain-containing protein [bacterium]